MKLKAGWYLKVASSALEKEILRLIVFWYPKANPYRDGYRWLVWSIAEWQERLPYCGKHGKPCDRSVRTALTHLQREGILTTARHRHPYHHCGGPVLWVRPNVEGICRILAGSVPEPCRIRAETYIQNNSPQSSDMQASSGEPQEVDQAGEDDVPATDFLAKKKKGAGVAAGLAVFDKKKETADDWPLVHTPQRAHECLRAACLVAGHPAPGSFNKKRGGQMKTFLRRLKEEGVEGGDVGILIFFVAARWSEFTGWSKSKFGVTVPGTVPNHDALTMYAVEAVGFWQSYATAAGPVQESMSAGGSNLDEDL